MSKYWMYKVRPDGSGYDTSCGDSGHLSVRQTMNEDGSWREDADLPPAIGSCMRVGSAYARTYQMQDWWQTSHIVEIMSDETFEEGRRVIFKTRTGSVYEWRQKND